MGRNMQVPVCPECIQKGRFLHGKEKSSSLLPTSFFKIMQDHDFSKHMYIPPLFGRTVSALHGKKVILMDSRGRQWEVTMSIVNGSLAFEEGWDVFSSDHLLSIGNLLIFNYNSKFHFDVFIYDESGCEKHDFSKKINQKKRCRDISGSSDMPIIKRQHSDVDLEGIQNNREFFPNYDNNNNNNNGKAQSVFITEHFEDPCLTSRDLGDRERDYKTYMFDVVDCELLNNCGGTGAGKVQHCQFVEGSGLSKVIKREPGQSFQHFNEDNGSHSQTATTVSCVVPTDNDNFLELPAPLRLCLTRGEKNGEDGGLPAGSRDEIVAGAIP